MAIDLRTMQEVQFRMMVCDRLARIERVLSEAEPELWDRYTPPLRTMGNQGKRIEAHADVTDAEIVGGA